MKILAIETSCDETSAAVTENNKILSNVISSQVDLHKKWGGVVPDIARRAHKEQIDGVIKESLKRSDNSFKDIDYIAVTYGPGLAIALEVGITKAKELAFKYTKPIVAVNHMEAHLLSSFAVNSKGNHPKPPKTEFPSLGLVVSGGHTDMVSIKNFGDYKLLGQTLDDAAGEAFDKVAKMLDLGYPGGPIISEFAKKGKNTGRFELPVPMQNSGDLNFSYSGLKTACLYKIKEFRETHPDLAQKDWIYDFCAEFVDSVVKSIQIKISGALEVGEIEIGKNGAGSVRLGKTGAEKLDDESVSICTGSIIPSETDIPSETEVGKFDNGSVSSGSVRSDKTKTEELEDRSVSPAEYGTREINTKSIRNKKNNDKSIDPEEISAQKVKSEITDAKSLGEESEKPSFKNSFEMEPEGFKQILIGGGVISNTGLRRGIRKTARDYGLIEAENKLKSKVYQPYSTKLFTDNAGMIGTCAYFNIKNNYGKILRSKDEIEKLDRVPTLGIEEIR